MQADRNVAAGSDDECQRLADSMQIGHAIQRAEIRNSPVEEDRACASISSAAADAWREHRRDRRHLESLAGEASVANTSMPRAAKWRRVFAGAAADIEDALARMEERVHVAPDEIALGAARWRCWSTSSS